MALPRRHRLKGQGNFDRLYRRGRRLHGTAMVLRWLDSEPGESATDWRCGVVISAKVHKRAVQRNRLRRLLHAHLIRSLDPARLPCSHWLLLSLKPGSAESPREALLGECSHLLQQAGLLP